MGTLRHSILSGLLLFLLMLWLCGDCSARQPVQEQPVYKAAYKEIVSAWIIEAERLVSVSSPLSPIEVKRMEYGRIESIPSQKRQKGVVIGAPHGTFDAHTAEVVRRISHRTGLAAVVAEGFSPTECSGWRINVNRPTERLYPGGEPEIGSKRANEVYQAFKQAVLQVSRGSLDLYIDIHQNGRQNNIEVATLGLTKAQAHFIKDIYRKIRDQMLRHSPNLETVELTIEPLDAIEIGAWAAKAKGILGIAKQSLHIELPAHRTLGTVNAREAYQSILAILIQHSVAFLLPPAKRLGDGYSDLTVPNANIESAGLR